MITIEIILSIISIGYLFIEKFFKTSKNEDSEFKKATLTGKILLFIAVIVAIGSVSSAYKKNIDEQKEKILAIEDAKQDSIRNKAITDSILNKQQIAEEYMLKQYQLDTASFNKIANNFTELYEDNLALITKMQDNYKALVHLNDRLSTPVDTSNLWLTYNMKIDVNSIDDFQGIIDSCRLNNKDFAINEIKDLNNVIEKIKYSLLIDYNRVLITIYKKNQEVIAFNSNLDKATLSAFDGAEVYINKEGFVVVPLIAKIKKFVMFSYISYLDLDNATANIYLTHEGGKDAPIWTEDYFEFNLPEVYNIKIGLDKNLSHYFSISNLDKIDSFNFKGTLKYETIFDGMRNKRPIFQKGKI